MADLDDIFTNNWDSDNVDTPIVVRSELRSVKIYNRAVCCRLVRQREDYMGILGRDHYTPDSHDAWVVYIVSTTQSDAQDMLKETRRICAQYNGTADEDKFITWQVGDWDVKLPHRWVFRFVVLVQKAGIDLGF